MTFEKRRVVHRVECMVQGFELEHEIHGVECARKVVCGPGADAITRRTSHHWGKLQIQNLLFESVLWQYRCSGSGAEAPKDWIRQGMTHALVNQKSKVHNELRGSVRIPFKPEGKFIRGISLRRPIMISPNQAVRVGNRDLYFQRNFPLQLCTSSFLKARKCLETSHTERKTKINHV